MVYVKPAKWTVYKKKSFYFFIVKVQITEYMYNGPLIQRIHQDHNMVPLELYFLVQ